MEPLRIVMEQLRDIARGGIEIVPQLAVAIIVLLVTWIIAWAVKNLLRRVIGTRLRPSLQSLFVNLGGIGTWLFGIMIAAIVVFPNLTPANMLAGLGIGSVAIGFAFKDIFENFLAGIIILFREKMRIGDYVECDGIEGKVEEISIRETHIRQTDGQLVIVPNSLLFKSPLTIRTDLDQRRTTVICGVAYGEDVDAAREVILKAVESCKTVIGNDRPVQIFAREFNSSSIDFEVTWWTGSKPVDIHESRDEVVAAVKRALDDAGIEIPYPYRTLTFAEPLALGRADRDGPNSEGASAQAIVGN